MPQDTSDSSTTPTDTNSNEEPELDNSVSFTNDISAMFNERGYLRSNKVSYDENELINDFNFNLMYTFPMFNFKGKGEMDINLSLTYNGSVGHQFICANPADGRASNLEIPRYNINSPEWIINFNGIAVQLFNFETDWFTNAQPNQTVSNNNVHLLTSGYQITDNLAGIIGTENHDYINILAGDGSVITLENTIPGRYYGTYYSSNKRDYTIGIVNFDLEANNCPDFYKNRTMDLMKGDGLVYTFTEYKINYSDYTKPTSCAFGHITSPQVFLLTSIKDKFGHYVNLDYEFPGFFNQNVTGRPVLKQITSNLDGIADIIFEYFSNGVRVSNTYKGAFIFNTTDYGTQNGQNNDYHNRRPQVNFFIDPLGRKTSFQNSIYTRNSNSCKDLRQNIINASVNLYRLTAITNHNGGKKIYSYRGPQNLSISNNVPAGQSIHSLEHKGQGRDIFFTNMVQTKNVYHNPTDANPYRIENFDPGFTEVNDDFNINPVDENDIYISTITKTSNETNGNNSTPTSYTTSKEYKNYKTWQIFHQDQPSDFIGETKLIKETYSSNLQSNYKIVEYKFDRGSSYTIPHPLNYTVYDGSFMDTMVTETFEGVPKVTRFYYTFVDNFLGNYKFNNPYSQKITIDPFLNKTIQTFYNDTLTSMCYSDGKFISNYFKEYYKNYFLNIPLLMQRRDANDNLLYKEELMYITDRHSSLGYVMQLINKKIYDVSNQNNFINTSFTYCKEDTTGKHVFGSAIYNIPGKEGNPKSETDANGNIKKYYYHPITASEKVQFGDPEVRDNEGRQNAGEYDVSFIEPEVSYKKVFENGSSQIVSSKWEDRRLPTRIDSYTDETSHITEYMNYDPAGNVTKSINNNGYIGNLSYDANDRIINGIFPYDFSNTYTYDSLTYDTVITEINTVVGSDMWGCKNAQTGVNLQSNNISIYGADFSTYCNLGYYFNGDQYVNKNYAKMRFSNPGVFNDLYEINSATFEFYPTFFEHYVGSDSSRAHFKLKIFPISNFYDPPITESYSTDLNNVNTIHNVNHPAQSQINWCNLGYDFYNSVDITSELKRYILDDHKSFDGIMIGAGLVGTYPEPFPAHSIGLEITQYVGDPENANCWRSNYSPKLRIKAKKRKIYPRIIKIYARGTFRYTYDDANNKTESFYKMYNSSNSEVGKKTNYIFDGFYKLKETNVFTSPSGYNTFTNNYNYLDLNAKTTDARGNETKYSYDNFLNNSETQNADNTITSVATEHLNGLSYTFGNINGLITKQTFSDEVQNKIEKYTDAVGNLRREVRFIDYLETPEALPSLTPLITDYKYDDLYRVIEVRTPEDKRIHYSYDGFGRQVQRTTPDAGVVIYKYDKTGNLRFSQDENQAHAPSAYRPANRITFRRYDGINRVLAIGEAADEDNTPSWEHLNPETVGYFENYQNSPANFLTINVYDTLSSAIANIFTAPSGYTSALNNTKGNLVATAYRTRPTDQWNFKYYRYDARGRVIRMWNVIDGLGTKITDYSYNSQNQVTMFEYQPGADDNKRVRYDYDNAGRLANVVLPAPPGEIEPGIEESEEEGEEESDSPPIQNGDFLFANYTYNQNSQIDKLSLNRKTNIFSYEYNSRNWVGYCRNNINRFVYAIGYNSNGNISSLASIGSYKNNFSDTAYFYNTYTYDKANRLINSQNTSGNFAHALANTYDKDGNILTLSRSNNGDNFNYQYYSGTNKLKKVSGSTDQYTYDYNGNLKTDEVNKNYDGLYDYRNLLIYISQIRNEDDGGGKRDVTYVTRYYYDEAGNRARKVIFKKIKDEVTGEPEWDNPESDNSGNWQLMTDEYYVRDASGKEIANYTSGSLQFWNIYGADNVGRINADTTKQFYLKDHLGSICAVTNSSNEVISAYDYDAWGYKLREWKSGDDAKYHFTGKERDSETGYDYFGARYYDSRIGRWGGVEPLYDKYIESSPYCYAVNNSLSMKDVNGKDATVSLDPQTKTAHFTVTVFYISENGYGHDDRRVSSNSIYDSDVKTYENYFAEAQNDWNAAAKNGEAKYYRNGVEYTPDFTFEFKPVSNKEELLAYINKTHNGTNYFKETYNENPSVKGNQLTFIKCNSLWEKKTWSLNGGSIPKHWKAHEFGHLMGLIHTDNLKDDNVMGYGITADSHKGPSGSNLIQLYKDLDARHYWATKTVLPGAEIVK
ncbi:MAG: hypothetical protein K1X86_11845 [Ignavibacteria bacterium]|nr:hypothetical protein [Ignavibacteria bacterium]